MVSIEEYQYWCRKALRDFGATDEQIVAFNIAIGGSDVTEENVRYHAQRALSALDYLDTHVLPRKPEYATAIANSIDDLRKHLFKLIGTNSAANVNS